MHSENEFDDDDDFPIYNDKLPDRENFRRNFTTNNIEVLEESFKNRYSRFNNNSLYTTEIPEDVIIGIMQKYGKICLEEDGDIIYLEKSKWPKLYDYDIGKCDFDSCRTTEAEIAQLKYLDNVLADPNDDLIYFYDPRKDKEYEGKWKT